MDFKVCKHNRNTLVLVPDTEKYIQLALNDYCSLFLHLHETNNKFRTKREGTVLEVTVFI